MFCKNCGRQLDEGETLCPACGTENVAETPAAATVEYEAVAVDATHEQLKEEMAGETFKWGLISLIFSATGCLSLLGFIFSFIAKSKALAFEQTFGELEGKAKAGRILGKIGFGVGLGFTIYMAFAFCIGVFAGLMEAGVM